MSIANYVSWAVRKGSPRLFFALRRSELSLRSLRVAGSTRQEKEAQKRLMAALCKPDRRSLDVGAHMGTLCVPMATKIGTPGHVYAFEGFGNDLLFT